jgi:hypothetical protein
MEVRTITINYSPREWATRLHNSKSRWNVIVSHRRSGKTVAAINHLIRDAIRTPQARFAYIAPTYKQSKLIAWDYLKEYSRPIPNIKINESELRIDYPNGSRITLYGADNPDSLRGIALWGVVFDEYSQQPSNIFSEIVRPALADHQGYAIWIGTPKGKNEFYRLYEKAKKEESWLALHLSVDDTQIIPQSELEDAQKVMTPDEFQQEFYCSFEAAIQGAYYADNISQARKDGRITAVPYDERLPVMTWWDLGMSDATAIGFFQQHGLQWRLFDCYENSGEGLAHYAKILKEKNYNYSKHFAPHDIEVKELGSGQSRKEIAYSLGIPFQVAPKLPIQDGINAVRSRFSQLWIDETKCQRFLDCISQYRKEWDDKRGEFKKDPLHDWTSHFADMLRYWAVTPEQQRSINNLQYKPIIYE